MLSHGGWLAGIQPCMYLIHGFLVVCPRRALHVTGSATGGEGAGWTKTLVLGCHHCMRWVYTHVQCCCGFFCRGVFFLFYRTVRRVLCSTALYNGHDSLLFLTVVGRACACRRVSTYPCTGTSRRGVGNRSGYFFCARFVRVQGGYTGYMRREEMCVGEGGRGGTVYHLSNDLRNEAFGCFSP